MVGKVVQTPRMVVSVTGAALTPGVQKSVLYILRHL